jgi:hypothetical protein
MNDKDRKQRPWIPLAVVLVSLGAVCVLGLVVYTQWWCAGWTRLSEWEALYNTTDGICDYVERNHKWPRDWESLTSSIAYVGGDMPFARDRVDVNFAVDFKSERHADEWYVRVKSGGFRGDERNSNDRLRKLVSFYSEVRRRTTIESLK